MPEPLALSLDAAAEALSVSPRIIRRLLNAGNLQRVRIGRAVRITAASLRA
jgi:excisionase family DNA binding protein